MDILTDAVFLIIPVGFSADIGARESFECNSLANGYHASRKCTCGAH
jgi:hypothetical protein